MKRSAFTLVELLVVVAIIALLAALLITAVGGAREAARRGQCLTRQRDLAFAMIDYSTANKGLPGYLEQPLASLPPHSWAVAIMPGIGETKRYEALMKDPPDPQATTSLPALLCPSDNPREERRLNYVVNCGPAQWNDDDITGNNAPHFILFKDRRSVLTSINTKVPIEEIPDGASNTILLSENAHSGIENVWHEDWKDTVKFARNELPKDRQDPNTNTRSSDAVKNLGFVWARQSNYLPNSLVPPLPPRPSSRHPGTVVVAFADGRAEAINDDIGIDVWLRLVCPDDTKARLHVDAGGLGLLGL